MNSKFILAIIGAAIFTLAIASVVTFFVMQMNAQTEWNRLNNMTEASVDQQASYHDELWSKISGIAQVDKQNDTMYLQYTEAWKVAVSNTANLNQAVGQVFPMLFQQAGLDAPQLEIKKELVRTIQESNSEFTNYRTNVTVACTAFNDYVTNAWNKFLLPETMLKKKDCNALIITSTRTRKASETGVDDNKSIY